MALLSIITVNFNRLDDLKITAASVLALPESENFEWLVVDGASQDGSVEYLKSLQDKRLRFISEKDKGIYDAMNKAIGQSRGTHLFYLNSGDSLYREFKPSMVAPLLEKHDFLYFNLFLKHQDGYDLRRYPTTLGYQFFLLSHLCHQALIISKRCLEKATGFDTRWQIAADLDQILKIIFKQKITPLHCPQILSIFDMSGISSSEKRRSQALNEINLIQRKHLPPFKRFFFGKYVFILMAAERAPALARNFLRLLAGPFLKNGLGAFLCHDYFYPALPTTSPKSTVLMMNTDQVLGGSAKASLTFLKSLASSPTFNTDLLTLNGSGQHPKHIALARQKMGWSKLKVIGLNLIDMTLKKLLQRRGEALRSFDLVAWANLADNLGKYRPQILHLHWVQGGLLRLKDLKKFNGPIVWSLHDLWPLLGIEHVLGEFKEQRNSVRLEILRLYNVLVLRKKRKVFKDRKIIFTAPSLHLMELARNLQRKLGLSDSIVHLPNAIDTEDFFPMNKLEAKSVLGITTSKKLILLSAIDLVNDSNKGLDLFIAALKVSLKKHSLQDTALLVLSNNYPESLIQLGVELIHLSPIREIEKMRALYSSAHVTVVPSRFETFGYTCAESLACGSPVVAFNTGAHPEMIQHQINGSLVSAGSVNELGQGISYWLERNVDAELSKLCFEGIKSNFGLEQSRARLEKIYSDLLK